MSFTLAWLQGTLDVLNIFIENFLVCVLFACMTTEAKKEQER